MTVYLVERSLKDIAMSDLAAAQQAAIRSCRESTEAGQPVHYLRTTFVPSTGACMCLFEAGSPQDVEQVNRQAGIPFDRITEALDLPG